MSWPPQQQTVEQDVVMNVNTDCLHKCAEQGCIRKGRADYTYRKSTSSLKHCGGCAMTLVCASPADYKSGQWYTGQTDNPKQTANAT